MVELGDAPIEAKYQARMNEIACVLDEIFNGNVERQERKTGFVLLCFPFGDVEGRCNFISNGALREDVICLFKEMSARLEGQPEITGHG